MVVFIVYPTLMRMKTYKSLCPATVQNQATLCTVAAQHSMTSTGGCSYSFVY